MVDGSSSPVTGPSPHTGSSHYTPPAKPPPGGGVTLSAEEVIVDTEADVTITLPRTITAGDSCVVLIELMQPLGTGVEIVGEITYQRQPGTAPQSVPSPHPLSFKANSPPLTHPIPTLPGWTALTVVVTFRVAAGAIDPDIHTFPITINP
jgi:hypothetical protein